MHSILNFYIFFWRNKSIFFFFLTISILIGILYISNDKHKLESIIETKNYNVSDLNLNDYEDYEAKASIKDNSIKTYIISYDVENAKQRLQNLNKEIISDISYDILKRKKEDLKIQSNKVMSLFDKKKTLDNIKNKNQLDETKLKIYEDEVKVISDMYHSELVKYQEMSLDFDSFNLDRSYKVTYSDVKSSTYGVTLSMFFVLGFIVALLTIALKNITHKTFNDELEIKKATGIKAFEGLSKFKKLEVRNNELVSGRLKIHSLTEISRIFKYISQRDRKVFEVVSSIKGEGNTSLVEALAENAASTNKKVLLIDLNLKNMDLSVNLTKKVENWEIKEKKYSSIDEKIIPLNSNLDFLPALKDESSLNVLKTTSCLKDFTKYLSKKYDYIFYDTTAVNSINIHNLDSVILSGVVDGVVVNYLANSTPQRKLLEAIENLRMVDSNILCIVTNNKNNPRLKQELLAFCGYLEKFNKSLAGSLRVRILKSSLLDEE